MRFRIAAEMIERQGVQLIDHQRRRQIVVEQRQIVRRRLQPAIEAAQIIDCRGSELAPSGPRKHLKHPTF